MFPDQNIQRSNQWAPLLWSLHSVFAAGSMTTYAKKFKRRMSIKGAQLVFKKNMEDMKTRHTLLALFGSS